MVRGIDSFRDYFKGFEDQYTIIGGTACDLLMSNDGLSFRATKDIDLVLIIEAINSEFGRKLWEYIDEAGYGHRNKSTGELQFYRFSDPFSNTYPFMIELFSRKPDIIHLPADAVLTPFPMEDEISSLSAILLNDEYYAFLRKGRIRLSGITVLDAPYLIPFKAKAWLDLSDKKNLGIHVNSRDIKKHKNDVFRLTELLPRETSPLPDVTESIKRDMNDFIERMAFEETDILQLGIPRKTKEEILDELKIMYTE